jgi:hypothetical protein
MGESPSTLGRYYFKHFTLPAAKPLRDVLQYVRQTWPKYWARRGGRDHLIVMTQDQGNRFVRESVRESTPLIMIHHWGAPASVKVDGQGQGDHKVGFDITVPPFHGEQARLNRWMLHGDFAKVAPLDAAALRLVPAEDSFKHDLFFSGKMNLNWGRHYSLGVRQGVYRAHRRHPRFKILTFDNGVQEKLPFPTHVDNYASAKFCLAPAGYGFSSRQYAVMAAHGRSWPLIDPDAHSMRTSASPCVWRPLMGALPNLASDWARWQVRAHAGDDCGGLRLMEPP